MLVNDGVISPPLKFGKLSFWREEDIMAVVDKIVAGEFDDGKVYGRPRKIEKELAEAEAVEPVKAEITEPVEDKAADCPKKTPPGV